MKNFLKIVMIILLVSLISVPVVFSTDVPVTFVWTPNTEVDMKQYVLYNRVEDQGYDYEIPMKIIPCTIDANGNCMTDPSDGTDCTTSITLNVPDNELVTNHFILRAEDIYENRSEDSNEVTYVSNLTPLLAITDLTGVFNKAAQTVDFTWTQGDVDRITSWQLFKGIASGGPYNSVMTIPWDGSATTITASLPADTLAPGEEYYFVVVAFGDNLNSPDSNEVKIDRKPPTKVIQLKITLQ